MADVLLKDGPAALRRSPLGALEDRFLQATVTGDRAVSLRERPSLTMVSLRVAPGSDAAVRIGEVLGAPLPDSVGQTTAAGPHTVLWLAPDEWLLVSQAEVSDVVPPLVESLGPARGAVVDVSANRTTLELSGPSARAVLEKGCPVDLHPRAFGPGRAVTTTLGPVPVLLWQSGPETYRLLPRSSFAEYVARWLLDAMAEFGAPEVP
jgi:heterotetrameric sarcosine oxidase gamma subunit